MLDGGAAERAGVRPDDIVLSINGRIVTSVDDIHRLLNVIPADQPLNLGLLRGDRLLERTLA